MKIRYLIIATLALSLAVGCKKKKKDETSAPTKDTMAAKKVVDTMGAKKVDMGTKPDVKKPDVKKPDVKKPVAPVATMKGVALGEIGVPQIAVYINFKKLLANDIIKGLMAKNKDAVSTGMETKSFDKVMACMGNKAKKPTDIMEELYAFGDNGEKKGVVILKVNVDTTKFVACTTKEGKDTKKAKFGGKDAVMTKKGFTFVSIGKNMILGAMGDYLTKIKPGEGVIGKGDVASYFTGEGCVRFMANDIPTSKMGQEAKMLIGTIKDISAKGSVGMPDAFKADVDIDVKDAGAAGRIVGFIKPLLTTPKVVETIKGIGLDPKLLNSLTISNAGALIKIAINLPKEDLKKIIGALEAMKGKKGPAAKKVDAKAKKAGAKVKKVAKKAKK
ncbi:hypothetical protein KKF84_00405 [Myxococcota bacterium]|nr:hypothetical protein [Myxococcota bacterium]MBU1533745.1 hypothetical protein [Myxococcota bacterium]